MLSKKACQRREGQEYMYLFLGCVYMPTDSEAVIESTDTCC